MIDFLIQYGLFLAKTVTFLIAIGIIIAMIFGQSRRSRSMDKLEVKNLNERYRELSHIMKNAILPKKEYKKVFKAEKAQLKAEQKDAESGERKKRVFVVDFHGDIKATAVASLREEITAILTLATADDEIVVKLENAGGLVHEHGLAASQLQRIKQANVPLTIAIDKVAASGGYMMACVADHIVAAPFAVVGSIGVLAQIPNFNRLLEKHGVDFELITAGELKRTLTMFGVNTDEDRVRFTEQLEDTHTLFKNFVAQNRPALSMDNIATGEHWYGLRALELNLVDELLTSDDYLLKASENADIYEINYTAHKRFSEKLVGAMQNGLAKMLFAFGQGDKEAKLF